MAEIVLLRHSMTKGNLEGRYIGCRTDEPLCEEGVRLLKSRSYPAVDRIYASPMRRCVETAQIIWGFQGQEDSAESGSLGETAAQITGGSCGQKDPAETRSSGKREVLDHRTGQRSQGQQIPLILVPGLRECDFGDFENKNYQELNKDPVYQAWIDSGGRLPFPGGESVEIFKRRCQKGFAELVVRLTELERQCAASDHLGRTNIAPDSDRTDRKAEMKTEAEKTRNNPCNVHMDRPFRAALVVHGGTIMAILERFGHPKKDYFDYQVKNGCGYLLTPVEGTDLWNYQCL